MDSDAWKIIHIPEKPALPPDHHPTVKVYASDIKPTFVNKPEFDNTLSKFVRHLCKIAPLKDLRHVKRVRKILPDNGETQLTVILCRLSSDEHYNHSNDMPLVVQELVDSFELNPFITEVSKCAAKSKEEWEEQYGISGFSEEETQSIYKLMRVVIDKAVSGHKSVVNAAVIVNPSVRQIIASETDQVYALAAPCDMSSTETMPFKETGEICVDDILEKQNCSSSVVACLNPWNWSLQPYNTEWHPLRHASIVAIESSSDIDRYLYPNSSKSFGQDHVQLSNTELLSKKQKTSNQCLDVQNDSKGEAIRDPLVEKPYLCTGCDIFLAWEPCTMCAMVLVHQRIKRIFYAFPNLTAGGLGGVHRLQGEKSLNHHYAVFRVLLPDDVQQLIRPKKIIML